MQKRRRNTGHRDIDMQFRKNRVLPSNYHMRVLKPLENLAESNSKREEPSPFTSRVAIIVDPIGSNDGVRWHSPRGGESRPHHKNGEGDDLANLDKNRVE